MFATEPAGYAPVLWSPRVGVYQALHEINNKSDGIADNLLPNSQILFAYRDGKCDPTVALAETLFLTQYAFDGAAVSAIVGAGCSGASTTAAQVAGGSQVPIISPSSHSPALSEGRTYPYFLRTVPSDAFTAISMVD
eukprot:1209728-Prymnesium_polylepis.1